MLRIVAPGSAAERAARLVVGAGFCGPGTASAAGGSAPPGVIVDLRRGLNLAVLHRALERGVIARDPGGGAVGRVLMAPPPGRTGLMAVAGRRHVWFRWRLAI